MGKDPDVRLDKLFVVGEVMPVEVSYLFFTFIFNILSMNWAIKTE